MKRMACVVALATGTGLALGVTPKPALAEPYAAPAANGLQITLAAPPATTSDSTLLLDLNFSGGNVRSVELYVDGKLIKRQPMRTREGHGLISFALDGALLSDGDHTVLIKAFDVTGNCATASSRVKITPEESNAPVRFTYPKRNTMVQGVVPIQVEADASLRNLYVIFTVDDDFLSLSNYAPYTYNWDTTHVANGVHTIHVKALDGDTQAEVRSLKMQVTVNNPGGFTMRKKEIESLAASKRATGRAESGSPSDRLEPMDAVNSLLHSDATMPITPLTREAHPKTAPQIGEAHGLFDLMSPFISLKRSSIRSTPGRSAFAVPPTHDATARVHTSTHQPSLADRFTVANALDTLKTPALFGLARNEFAPHRDGNIAAVPGERIATPAVSNTHNKPVLAKLLAFRGKQSVAKANPGPLADLSRKTFDVAFDDTKIAFDVPPRVEKGLPLAPFRAIFEHTGGTVQWYNQSKTVRAVNSSHEIVIRVGKSEAKVNNQTVKMEAKPYLDRGRTIVPLSFIRDAMDVKVDYDPQSGHLRIESNKK